MDQYQLGIQDYDIAIRIDPRNILAYNSRGAAYHQLSQPVRAIQDYDEVIRLDPEFAGAYVDRGLANTDLGNDDLAQRDFDRASELGFDRNKLDRAIEGLTSK